MNKMNGTVKMQTAALFNFNTLATSAEFRLVTFVQ